MAIKSDVIPFKIPKLKSRNMRIGNKDLLRRSYSVVPDDFFRICQFETLHLEVEFRQESLAMVFLYTNIDCLRNEWQELRFKWEKSRTYSLSYQVKNCGSFKFKLKYSLDKGRTWYWDRVPFSQAIVDPAGLQDIRMYTLIPRVSGAIYDWTEKLTQIAGLGFNAVHLLPITSRDASESPYAAHDLFTIDKSYGAIGRYSALTDFEGFIVKARELGIRLCFDLVLNHIGVGSKMVRMCPEWIVPDMGEEDGMKRASCWHMNCSLKWGDLVKIYYDHPHPEIRRDIWDYMKKYALFWSHFANLTGGMIRLDNLHASHEGFIADLLGELRSAYPDLIIAGEFFSDFNTIMRKASEGQVNLFSANPWEYPYAGDLRNYLRYIHHVGRKVRYYLPITTHDTGAPAQLFGKAEAAVPRYAVTALMGTGQTGIVQGVEQGHPEKIEFIGMGQKYEFREQESISTGIRSINRVFAEAELFRQPGNLEFIDADHGAVLGALRLPEEENERGYLIFANLDIQNAYRLTVDISSFLKHRERVLLEDRLNGAVRESPVNEIEIEIEPCGVRIFRVGG